MRRSPVVAAAAVMLAAIGWAVTLPAQQSGPGSNGAASAPVRLTPTSHPPVPSNLNALWYVPAQGAAVTPPLTDFVRGVRLLDEEGNAAAALPLLSQGALASTAVADYARFYTGRALLDLKRYPEAEAAFTAVAAKTIEGHLPEDAALGRAQAREARLDFAGAVAVYDELLQRKLAAPQVALSRLAASAQMAGQTTKAIDAYRRVYFEYPLSAESTFAEDALTRLNAWSEDEPSTALELKRADALFEARRWAAARASYERARDGATGAERDRVSVRIAATDVHLKRFRQARDPLKGQLAGAYGDEANFYYLAAVRGLGGRDEYIQQGRAFADAHPHSPFAHELLNNLATHFIVEDQDDRADEIFKLMIERDPGGRFTERAYWRSGWWAYRDGRHAEAASLFDRGAAQFPRSDYRPSWLYWSARAWNEAGNTVLSNDRLTLVATDYFNSYYGRLARKHLADVKGSPVVPQFARKDPPAPAAAFPTAAKVGQLIAVGLNREALNELQYAQRMWGDSAPLAATIALVQNRLGNLRVGINVMKRAYPQWLAAGGESLPAEIQKVVFPLNYWPLLQKHAAARGLDPFLVAALVAQESTFDPVIRSSANAVGLMQVLPSTGRQFARKLKITNFTAEKLTDPETNVRLGTAIFAESIRKFGGVHYALAAYNAGDHRVSSWQRERPGMPQDVFIDDIPFPETQNYVKRILGTAEDYRRLYGK